MYQYENIQFIENNKVSNPILEIFYFNFSKNRSERPVIMHQILLVSYTKWLNTNSFISIWWTVWQKVKLQFTCTCSMTCSITCRNIQRAVHLNKQIPNKWVSGVIKHTWYNLFSMWWYNSTIWSNTVLFRSCCLHFKSNLLICWVFKCQWGGDYTWKRTCVEVHMYMYMIKSLWVHMYMYKIKSLQVHIYMYMYQIKSLWVNIYMQWCGNSQSCRTLSDKSSECLVNWNWTVYKVYGEQDKSGENRSKCPAVGSTFPHSCVYVQAALSCA